MTMVELPAPVRGSRFLTVVLVVFATLIASAGSLVGALIGAHASASATKAQEQQQASTLKSQQLQQTIATAVAAEKDSASKYIETIESTFQIVMYNDFANNAQQIDTLSAETSAEFYVVLLSANTAETFAARTLQRDEVTLLNSGQNDQATQTELQAVETDVSTLTSTINPTSESFG